MAYINNNYILSLLSYNFTIIILELYYIFLKYTSSIIHSWYNHSKVTIMKGYYSMKFNNSPKKKSKIFKVLFIFLPFFSLLILIIFRNFFINLKNLLSPCYFREITGFYCPGCGNTRSVLALLNGDILSSLRYNLAPITILVLLFLVYIEQAA